MQRFARSLRSRAAAVAVAAVTTCLPACRSVSSEGDMVAASAVKSEHTENWIGWAPTPAPGQSAPRPVAASAPIRQAQVTIQPAQGQSPASGAAAPTEVASAAPSGPAYLPAQPLPGHPPTVVACGPNGCAPGGDQSDHFWGRSRGWSDQPANRPDWQNLPRLLGDQGRGPTNVASDLASLNPDDLFATRTSGASDPNGGTNTVQQFLVELTSPDGLTGFGATSGFRTQPNNDAQGLGASLYAKRVLSSSDDGTLGLGFGGTLPIGDDSRGNLFPWVFGSRRVTGDTWFQGLAGVTVPFNSAQDTFGFIDAGLVIPIAGRQGRPNRPRLYFMPELHANYLISSGDAGVGPGFVLNSTMGFGARMRGFDVQAGVAFPLLNSRFYEYESILRITYRF